MKRAFIGDIHGCYDEFQQLLDALKYYDLDEIWVVGDLVDRGPDSGKVVQIAIDNNIKSVMGNHEDSIIGLYDRWKKSGSLPNSYKKDTLLTLTDEHRAYIGALPPLVAFDDINLVLVHGGLWPSIPLYRQPHNVIRAQMILPHCYEKGEIRWWGPESIKQKSKKTEEETYAEGFRRWYQVYDGKENVIYGHSVFVQPQYHQNPGAGWTLGIDTGSCFGGLLTAVVIGADGKNEGFVSVRPKKAYCEDKLQKFLPR